MNRFLAFSLALALAGAAAAEETAKKSEPAKPALNLRLDDTSSGAPRISFEQRPSSQTKEDREKGLPDLGGKPSRDFERPVSSGSSAVIPKAYDPQMPGR
jgi:hypothetical protein